MRVIKHSLFNKGAIAKLMGEVLLIESAMMLLALAVCLVYGEADWFAFFISMGVASLSGLALLTLAKPHKEGISAHDGIIITSLAWLLIPLFGAVPLMLCDRPVDFTDAFFEAVSGFTTTGASVMPDVERLGHGVNFWRALMQWVGGLGIILFTLTLIPMLNKSGGMKLMAAESSDFAIDKTAPRVAQTARNLALTYLALTAACVLLLWAGPMDLFDSVAHTFSTISTGGFSPYGNGVLHFASSYVKVVILIFMFFGSVNFTLLTLAGMGRFRPILTNSTLRIFTITVLVAAALFAASMLSVGIDFTMEGMVVDPLFQVVSTISSTGYTAGDYESWGTMVLLFTLMLMFSGACMGSTTGGAKIDRLIIFFRNSRNELSNTINRNTIYTVSDGDKKLNAQAVRRVVTFLGIYIVLLLAGVLVLVVLGVGIQDSVFSVVSCTSNIGLGYGATGAAGGFATLPVAAKWILSFLMYLGRLELLTVLVIFLPTFWRG